MSKIAALSEIYGKKLGKAAIILAKQGPSVVINKTKRSLLHEREIIRLNRDYRKWLKKHYPKQAELTKQTHLSLEFGYRPKISVITPTYNTPIKFLEKCIESVLSQTYENWEYILVDDASTDESVRKTLSRFAAKDKRIKTYFRKENGHISKASNDALKHVTGEYVCTLDHDDWLWPNALYEVVATLQHNQQADIIYSDEDKIDEADKHRDPYFKPDWSEDLFYNVMYLAHLLVLKTSLVQSVGGFNSTYDGAQDWELCMRVVEKASLIVHIPTILYSWRIWSKSTAYTGREAKPYAYIAQRKALETMIKRTKKPAIAEDGYFKGAYHLLYLPKSKPLVSAIIATKDKADLLKQCIDGILNEQYENIEILIINNQSCEQATLDYFKEISQNPLVSVLDYNKPFNIADMYNKAVEKARGELVLFIGNDVYPMTKDWLSRMVGHMDRKKVGVVGALLYFPNGKIQHCGVVTGMGEHKVAAHVYYNFADKLGYFGSIHLQRNASAVTGACMLTRKVLYQQVGGFDAKNLPVIYNDVDFCLKVRQQGNLIVYDPTIQLVHNESATLGRLDKGKREIDPKAVQYMQKHWGKQLQHDPYYNPNFDLKYPDFRLAI